MSKVREETLKATPSTVQHHQSKQQSTFDRLEDEKINQTLAFLKMELQTLKRDGNW